MKAFLAISFLLALGLASASAVHALADPNVSRIEKVRRYTNVGVSGDALFVVHYDLEYTVAPAESITEGWIGRVLDVGGAGQLASVAPQAHHLIPLQGYSHGIYSFYFSVAPVPTGTLTFTLEGNPGLIPTPVGITTTSIEDRAASDLGPDMRGLGFHFEDLWNQDVISAGSGAARFTDGGANYFGAAVPNLSEYAPDLFSLGFTEPDPSAHDDGFDTTFQTSRDTILANTPLRGLTTAMAGGIGMPRPVFETFLALLISMAVGGGLVSATKQTEIGVFTFALTLAVLIFIGFGVIALIVTLGMLAAFALLYMIVWNKVN